MKSNTTNEIDLKYWDIFLKEMYPLREENSETYFRCIHPVMDSQITLEELNFDSKNIKNNKASRTVNINNDFYKKLPPKWIHYILNLFSQIMEQEKTPDTCRLYNYSSYTKREIKGTH